MLVFFILRSCYHQTSATPYVVHDLIFLVFCVNVSVFYFALIRPPNTQSWRLQSVTLTFLYQVSTQHGHDPDEENSDSHNSNSALSNNISGLNGLRSWSIVNEIGDGACLLRIRCIARHVFNNPLFYFIVRRQLLNHMPQHMHGIMPGSGANTFHEAITTGINEDYVKNSVSPQTHIP